MTFAVPSLRRTPLYDRQVAHGARFVDFGDWELPGHYSAITDEHHAVRAAAGVFDVSHRGQR
ncbi:MAG: glycine cleavage system aminomethyltransferase GcvT, partial [Gaiellaceae bacterium]